MKREHSATTALHLLEQLAHKDDVAQHALAGLQLRHRLSALLFACCQLSLLGGLYSADRKAGAVAVGQARAFIRP